MACFHGVHIPRRSSRAPWLAFVLFLLVLFLSGHSQAQTSIISHTDPGDGVPLGAYTIQGTYESIGPGGANEGKWFYVYPAGAPVCAGGADDGTFKYLYYGEVTGNYCIYHNYGWSVQMIPTVTACTTGYTLSAGLCSVGDPPPPDPPPVTPGAWDFSTNQLIHVVSLCSFFFMGFRQGFSA